MITPPALERLRRRLATDLRHRLDRHPSLHRAARRAHYEIALRRGRPAGDASYVFDPAPPSPAQLTVWSTAATPDALVDWCARQTLAALIAVGVDADGSERWRVGATHLDPAASDWQLIVDDSATLPTDPVFAEAALLTARAEDIDAVTLLPDDAPADRGGAINDADVFVDDPFLRHHTLVHRRAYVHRPNAAGDRSPVQPRGLQRLRKQLPLDEGLNPRSARSHHRRRRGPYRAAAPLPARLEVGVRDASGAASPDAATGETAGDDGRVPMLVTVPFLARGGAEHTLFETLRALVDRFAITLVSLAPHRAALGDRRPDFQAIWPRLISLGDHVHPAAMPGQLLHLIDVTGAEVLYNANGTTLFYDFAPRLKAARPQLRILDHLYDHQVGYIDRYLDGDLRDVVDAVVAENHRIARVLAEERGWPTARLPVIWPCGRTRDAFAPADARPALRRRLRAELGYDDDDLVVVTAARMHPQKRPEDFVHLASRLRARHPQVHLLLVGGGDLEDEVDRRIEDLRRRAARYDEPPPRIRRLPFRTDVPDLIVMADAGCLLSDYEGLPVFLLECLQAGRPFLGTDVGELGRVLRETGAGPVVDQPGDLDAIVAAVDALADPQQRRRYADRARAAAPHFDVEACAARYAAAFLDQPQPDAGPPLGGDDDAAEEQA